MCIQATVIKRQAVTSLTQAQINSYTSTPYTFYMCAGYCPPDRTLACGCGEVCNANPSFQPIASGEYPTLETIIVAHDGASDPNNSWPAILNDLHFILVTLEPGLFPGVSTTIQVHRGFKETQQKSATDVLNAVNQTMLKYGSAPVTMIGHSMGTTFKIIAYGLPRVGNREFANYDPVPVLPPIILGFVHPAGEVHIKDSGEWDNSSTKCSVEDVPIAFLGNATEHPGPYNGIILGCY
ncbi:hypothetical protein HYDPIDRAFT_178148 [Hydnomerulius pinastri MD-312]|uniref:Alpha/beta-hydrolase n=1 Tax=Hydnomerulius pinastri MD-312 TaxID=994086 RepID=A0A0C9UXR4_9AGAM|nr:hypothetical protein HYDPIDRAFT_178148 [Hydnomerulius pinastri MD-312]